MMTEKFRIFFLAMIAGLLIGIGVIINTTFLSIPIMGALLFSFGLLVIIELKLPLYTGKIGFAFHGQKHLFAIFLGNVIGIWMLTAIYFGGDPDMMQQITLVAAVKFSKTSIQMFCYGLMCGFLIHFAVKAKQFYTTIMAIMIFILMGAEHCIADFPYLLLTSIENFGDNVIKFLLVIAGNSFGAIILEEMLRLNENG